MRIAAQTFTLRRELEVDLGAALSRLRDAGFDAVELAGMAGKTAPELAGALRSAGIRVIAWHVGLDRLRRERDALLDDASVIGVRELVLPSLGDEQAQWTLADYERVAAELDRVAGELERRGFSLHIHNHATELAAVDGVRPLVVLIERTKERVGFELDLGWLRVAGEDPVDWLSRMSGRVRLVHLKDVVIDEGSPTFRPLGAGVIDWPPVLAACRAAGVEWGIVEDDDAIEGPFESLERSLAQLQALGAIG